MTRPNPAAALLLLLLALLAGGCSGDESAERDEGVSVNDLTDADRETLQSDYVGEEVSVSGEVTEILEPGAFAIGDDELLVVGDPPVDPADGLDVRITGTVHLMSASIAEEQGLTGTWVADREGDPVVVVG